MFGFGKDKKSLPASLSPKPQKNEEATVDQIDKLLHYFEELKEIRYPEQGTCDCGKCSCSACECQDTATCFCVIGSYPDLKIVKKFYVDEDEYGYCLRNKDSNNLGLYPKEMVFYTHGDAVNKVIELMQKQINACIYAPTKVESKKRSK